MRKIFTPIILILTVLIATSGSILKNSTGLAGYTGSPGESTCSNGGFCHNGGSSASKGVTVTATPSFTADQYMADSTYLITIQVAALGFNRYGFGCEILDSTFVNTGTMQIPGSGVKLLNAGNGRRNAVHTTPKFGTGGTSFSFQWVAPSDGRVNIYAVCNAVNLSGNVNGDLPIPAYTALYPAPLPPPDTTLNTNGLKNNSIGPLTGFRVFPNPLHEFANLSYSLQKNKRVSVELWTLGGEKIKELYSQQQGPGEYAPLVELPEVASGVYFIRINTNGEKAAQKLVSIQQGSF